MSHKTKKRSLIAAALLSCLVISAHSSAQQISEAEIQQAVDAMRAAGQSEEQIQQFLKSVEMIKAMQVPTVSGSQSQAEDIQKITGMSDEEMRTVGPISGMIKAQQDREIAGMLEREVAAFEERFADKPEITAVFDGKEIRLKLITGSREVAYTISAQAAPTEHNRSGIMIGANRGWSVQNGDWLAGIGVQIGGDNYRADLPSGPLPQTLSYDGPVTSHKTGDVKNLRFEVKCEE